MTDQLDPVRVSIRRMTSNLGADDSGLLSLGRPDWQASAACIGHDPNAFYDEQPTGVPAWIVALCGSCPVFAECDKWADDNYEAGTWAGISSRQRMNRWKRNHLHGRGKGPTRRRPETESLEDLYWLTKPPTDDNARQHADAQRHRRRRERALAEADG
jgi:hypothetical protein